MCLVSFTQIMVSSALYIIVPLHIRDTLQEGMTKHHPLYTFNTFISISVISSLHKINMAQNNKKQETKITKKTKVIF